MAAKSKGSMVTEARSRALALERLGLRAARMAKPTKARLRITAATA